MMDGDNILDTERDRIMHLAVVVEISDSSQTEPIINVPLVNGVCA